MRTGSLSNPFPEEANRVLATRLARCHFAPTESARQNLLAEAVPEDTIYRTGNTVIDALLEVAPRAIGPSLDFERTAVWHGIPGVGAEVHQYLADPRGVTRYRQRIGDLGDGVYFFIKRFPDDLRRFFGG